MPAKRTPKKPASIKLADRCTVRAVRGPKPADPRVWYWRADLTREDGTRGMVWSGWGTQEDACRAVLAELSRSGVDGAIAPRSVRLDTVADLLDAWLEHQQGRVERGQLAGSSFNIYLTSARRLHKALGSLRLERVFAPTLDRFAAQALSAGRKPRGINQDLGMFSMAWRWGTEFGRLAARPITYQRLRVEEDKYTPEPADWARVLAELPPGWARRVLEVQATTGLRIGALAKLRRTDVDLDAGMLAFRHKGKKRRIKLAPDPLAIIRRQLEGNDAPEGRVFHEVGEQTIRRACGKTYLKRACEAAGVPYFTPHGLRRMFGRELIRAGTPIPVYCEIMGHSIKVALEHYSAITAEDQADALAAAGIGGAQLADNVVPMRRRA